METSNKEKGMKFKKIAVLSLTLIGMSSYASNTVHLHNAPIESLNGFYIQTNVTNNINGMFMAEPQINTLDQLSQSNLSGVSYERYQQFYKGIKVVGAQVTIAKNNAHNMMLLTSPQEQVNGKLAKNIEVDTTPVISSQQAITRSLTSYNQLFNGYQVDDQNGNSPNAQLQIIDENNQHTLVYLVEFTAHKSNSQPQSMHYYIDAKTDQVLMSWDNTQNFEDVGPGGNEKTHEYWYGQAGMPMLDVTKSKTNCTMENKRVRTANLQKQWDDNTITPYRYKCGKNTGQDYINGAYSAINDAQYFGDVIIDMYKNWYDINALNNSNGSPMQLIMRVHYGANYDNAFWNGENMTFGDGNDFYPLVSLDVAGHEVSHGFTEQHSGLIYTNQSGSLNEAFSDMAGQTVRAYLLSQNEQDYTKFYPDDPKGEIAWGLGETIMKGDNVALRYMNNPSQDGNSADCYNPDLNGALACKISYANMLEKARGNQSYIVHTGSGVFNKAFYLLATKWAADNQEQGLPNHYVEGVKEAFHVMMLANVKYWTPSVTFAQAACGVVSAAAELKYSSQEVKQIFTEVGVDTSHCQA